MTTWSKERSSMRIPGYTAESALTPSAAHHRLRYTQPADATGAVTPAVPFLCAILGAACAAAILDPVPGSEIAMCGYFAARCAVSAVGGAQSLAWG
jgi:hypothetical protein